MRHTRARLLVFVEVALLAALSVAAYSTAYAGQRRLFLAGLNVEDPYTFPRVGVDPALVDSALTAYALGGAVTVITWVVVLLRSRSNSWRAIAWWPIGLTVIGYAVAAFARPSLSIDVLSYLSHGYLATTGFTNPYLQPAADVVNFPPGSALVGQGWTPVHPQTPYGPLWTHVERLAYLISGGDVGTGVLVLKVVAVAATLASGGLIWLIARRLRPGSELPATLGFCWCPLVMVQFGLDGHNDALAIAFVLVAIWAAGSGRTWLVVLALGLGGLTKLTPLIFLPPLLIPLLRTSASRRRVVGEAAGALLVVGLLGWLLWLGWWSGWATLDGLRYSSTPFAGPSPAGVLAGWLADPLAVELDNRPQLILAIALAVLVLVLSWHRTYEGAVAGCAVIAIAAFALMPVYWPWYAGLAIAVLSLRPSWVSSGQMLALTVGAMLTAPLGDLAAIGAVDFDTMFSAGLWWGLTVPVAVCLLLGLVGVLARRLVGERAGWGRDRVRRLPARHQPGPDQQGGDAEAAGDRRGAGLD